MNSKKILEDLLYLNAPSKREQIVANYVKNFAKANNITFVQFDSLIPKDGNAGPILFRIDGTKSTESILLSSHLDTVNTNHNEDLKIIKKGFIYESDKRNILGGDDRLGVAAALIVSKKAKENPHLHGGIEVLFTVQEELGCLSTKIFDFNVIKSKINYNLDGEGPIGSIITKAPTKARYELSIIGTPSHAALAPENGNNAIIALSKIITKLPQGRLDEETTTNIGMISGGKQTNVVAEKASIIAELRSLNYDKYLFWKDQISTIVQLEAKKLNVSSKLDFEIIYEGYSIEENNIVVQKFIKACSLNNIKPQLLTSQGGGDSNNINNNKIGSVVFGLAMHNIHTVDEFFDIRDFEKAIKLLECLLFN